MRVTLVYPSIGGRVRAAQMQPLSIAALAGLTPHDVALRFYDDRLETVDYDAPADLAGISVQTFTAKRAYEIYVRNGRKQGPGQIHRLEPAAKAAAWPIKLPPKLLPANTPD